MGEKLNKQTKKTHNNEHSPDWFDCITHQLSPHCLFSSLPGVPAVQSLPAEVSLFCGLFFSILEVLRGERALRLLSVASECVLTRAPRFFKQCGDKAMFDRS